MITSYNVTTQQDEKVTPKAKAQEMLLDALSIAFYKLEVADSSDISDMTEREKTLVWEQMDKQMKRIEKMFGYVEGSCNRGC